MTPRFLLIILLFFSLQAIAQPAETTQTIKGKVIDKQSKYPIIGAVVAVTSVNPVKGTTTDEEGEFRFTVPIGRHDIKVNYIGYKDVFLPNVLVTAGKEVVLTIELEELVLSGKEVVIIGEKDKTQSNNEMSVVSTRSFSIEETSRYAGSMNDPARMAKNFAGVAGSSDSRNDIIIRGNSPLGVLWRLEGIDIPNPNHFGSFGTTGGPISILNNNTLANSDFMTGAFPGQYGNALAGVFDLQMRKGNKDKYEFMGQIGFNGIEAGAEGPLSKNHRSSFLVNYRYSTLDVFKALGISFGTSSVPDYQDVSFKLDIPTSSKGKLSVFGIGGISTVSIEGKKVDTTDLFSDPGDNTYYTSGVGVLGVNHLYFINTTTSSKIGVAVSGNYMVVKNDSIVRDSLGKFMDIDPFPNYRNRFTQIKYTLSYTLNKKFSAKNTISAGMYGHIFQFDLIDSVYIRPVNRFQKLRDFEGTTGLLHAFGIWQHKFNDKLALTTGLHYQHFTFNNTNALEPRAGIKYQFKPNQSLSAGYGLHSQLQPFQAYFREDTLADGSYYKSNKNLDFTKSHQFVLAYDYSFSKDLRVKVETYYQAIFSVPVEENPSSFSMLNSGADFEVVTRKNMVNKGTGRNYGLELTLEKFYNNNYYFLFTSSLFDSKYKGSDKVLRNTAFNGNYVLNGLAGKEFKLNDHHTISMDFKATWAGGKRYTPIDLDFSNIYRTTYYLENEAFSKQFKAYIRVDFKVGYRMDGKKFSQTIALDVQNIFNRKNPLIQKYDIERKRILVVPQLGIFPVVQYKIMF
ncbi:MAG TPA: TonB-dependent receptor [Cytophagaceae bacterium]